MKRRQGDRWARAVLDGSCGLRRRTGEPYMPLEEEHNGRYQMRDSRCVRRELRLCCTGRESPVRRRVRSMTPTTDGGAHALRPKGAEALLHQKGEPHPTLNRQGYSRRGLTHRMEGSHATEGSQRLCCTGGKSLIRRRVRCIAQTTDGGLTLRPKGAVGLLHRKGSPVRCWKSKEKATDGGTLTASEGSCGSAAPEGRVLLQGTVLRVGRRAPIATEGSQQFCCTGSGSPVRHRARSATRNDGWRHHTATEGSHGSAAPEGEPRPTLNKQRDATDGGTLTASEGSCGSAAPEGRVPLAA